MVCIYCQHETRVINSRPQKRTNTVWRRRQCQNCHTVYTSTESVDLAGSVVVRKPSGLLEPFSRDKLLISVYDSLKHRKTAIDDAESLTNTIISRLYIRLSGATIGREEIISVATVVLKHFDKVAAISYGAFHPLN